MNVLSRQNLLFTLSALMILSIPWYASGKSAFSLLTLEILGGIQLLVLAANHSRNSYYGLGKLVWLFLFFLIISTAAYLIPLSPEQWSELPGRLRFTPAINWLTEHSSQISLSASLVTERTISSLILLLTLTSLFIAVSTQTDKMKKNLMLLVLFIAFIQGVLGTIQFSTKMDYWYFFEVTGKQNAVGTYLNRDHFSTLMYMILPVVLGLLSHHFSQLNAGSSRNQYSLVQVFGLTLLVILFVCAALFTGSRAGIALTALAMVLAIFIFALPVGGWKNAGVMIVILLSAIAAAMSVGIISALNRFIILNPFEDGRWEMFQHTIIGIKAFWPIGAGVGTFQEVYATIQPVEQRNFVNHAHNDYLELLFETGAIGAAILSLSLIIYLKTWINLRRFAWNESKFIRAAAGISLFLLLLHELVEFNLHTPANQVVFVVFCAIFISGAKRNKY